MDLRYYSDYLRKCYNTVEHLSEELHKLYVRRNNMANILYANINILESNDISKELIDDLIYGKIVNIAAYKKEIICTNPSLATILRINYNKFIYLCVRQIPKTIAIMRYYDWLGRMPKIVYARILEYINSEFGKEVLRGNNPKLGTYLGQFRVARYNTRDGADLRASYHNLIQMVKEGIVPFSPAHTDGVKWRVNGMNPYEWRLKWFKTFKGISVIAPIFLYRFRANDHFDSITELVDKYKDYTAEEIIECDELSLITRIHFMVAFDKHIMTRYKPVYDPVERKENNFANEYTRPKLDS